MTRPDPAPPTDLHDPEALALWRGVVGEFLLEQHHQQILAEACRRLQLAHALRAAYTADGLITEGGHGQKVAHPAIDKELAALRLFRALIRELGLDLEQAEQYTRPAAPAPTSNTLKLKGA